MRNLPIEVYEFRLAFFSGGRTVLRPKLAFSAFAILLLMATLFWPGDCANGQSFAPRNRGGLRPVLPLPTDLEARPLEGAAANQQWRTQRVDDERTPVAELLHSVKRNDAVIEVILYQGKLLTTEVSIADEDGVAVVAIGDPTVLDFHVLPDSRMIRLTGRRVGVTDLMLVAADGQTLGFEVHVVYDLELLSAKLKQVFPDAFIKLGQIREHLVVEGQARSDAQIEQILSTIQHYLDSAQPARRETSSEDPRRDPSAEAPDPSAIGGQMGAPGEIAEPPGQPSEPGQGEGPGAAAPGAAEGQAQPGGVDDGDTQRPDVEIELPRGHIINLLRVPGVHQVMLKVRIAELNRRALREIGADIQIPAQRDTGAGNFLLQLTATGTRNMTGVFPVAGFDVVMRALRENNVATILAEPNLVTLSGHVAEFHSGGEFAVPVNQQAGTTPGSVTVTVIFRPFGVRLSFLPYVQDNGLIRLEVNPEVSTISEELSVSLIAGGEPIPGLRTRRASTTVELRQGQTLAIAGLLNNEMDGATRRIPGLGDLPYVGQLFSRTQHVAQEQELLVTVTPYLVSPMNTDEPLLLPGQEIMEPNNLEFYLMNRIEGRTGRAHRSTTAWDCRRDDMHMQMQIEQRYLMGPVGLSE